MGTRGIRIGKRPERLRPESGQASLEYLLVGVALLATIVGMGVLWRFVSGDGLTAAVDACASHALFEMGGAADVLMF